MKKKTFIGYLVKSLWIPVCLFVLFILFPSQHTYAYEYTDDNGIVWEYTVPKPGTVYPYPGTAVISRCSTIPESGILEIPTSVDGIMTTGIDNLAFRSKKTIYQVVLPENIKKISVSAFEYCSNLKTINFPSSLETIEDNAFAGCGFETIEFPSSLHCTIHSMAFQDNKSLLSVAVNGNVQFKPSAGDVFNNCSKLNEYTASSNNQYYAASGGVLYSKDMSRLEAYPVGKSAESFTVPDSVSVISEKAFAQSKIKSVSLPAGLQEIRESAFSGSRYLEAVDIPSGVKKLDAYCFNQCQKLNSVTLHTGLEQIGERVFVNCASLAELELPEGLLTLENYAFSSMNNLLKIYMPDSVSEIGESVFTAANKVTVYSTNEMVLQYAADNDLKSVEATVEEYRAAEGQSDNPDPEPDPSGDEPDPDPVPPDPVVPTAKKSQTINCAASFTKNIGDCFNLNATAKTPLIYRTSDNKVATVDRTGNVQITGWGTCTITITARQSDIYRVAEKTVIINGRLARPVLKGKNKKPKKVRLKWNKISGATGYQLYIRYPGAKKYVPALKLPAKVKGVTHRGLSKNKTYRYKLRACKKVGKKIVYSGFSKAVKVRIKK